MNTLWSQLNQLSAVLGVWKCWHACVVQLAVEEVRARERGREGERDWTKKARRY